MKESILKYLSITDIDFYFPTIFLMNINLLVLNMKIRLTVFYRSRNWDSGDYAKDGSNASILLVLFRLHARLQVKQQTENMEGNIFGLICSKSKYTQRFFQDFSLWFLSVKLDTLKDVRVWVSVHYVVSHCESMDCSPPGSSVHGISQAGILKWVAFSFSRGSSLPKDRTHISCVSCIGSHFTW